MAKPRLTLDYVYVTRSSLIAAAVDDDRDSRVAPVLSYEAHLFDHETLFVFARATWGSEGVTPYFIEAEVNGSFDIDLTDIQGKIPADGVRGIYASLAINAAQILHGSLRGHISTVTAVAPHGIWFLPTETIRAEDVKLYVRDEESLFELMSKPPSRKRPAKEKKSAPAASKAKKKQATKKPR